MKQTGIILFFFLTCGLLSVFAIDPRRVKKSTAILPDSISWKNLTGDWWFAGYPEPEFAEEWSPDYSQIQHFRIGRDSVWLFEYPYQYYGSIAIDTTNPVTVLKPFFNSLRLSNDTLLTLEGYEEFKMFVRKDHFNDTLIGLLKRDVFNSDSLVGKWYLEIMRDEYDDDGLQKIIYPVALPPVLTFTKANLKTLHPAKQTVLLTIKGKPREFFIKELTGNHIILRSGKWCAQEFEVTYFDYKQVYPD